MWIKCHCPNNENIELKYNINDTKLNIISSINSIGTFQNISLIGCFNSDKGVLSFEFGDYLPDNNFMKLNKSYSIPYLKEFNICIDKLAYFVVCLSKGEEYKLFADNLNVNDSFTDNTLEKARQTLESIKKDIVSESEMSKLLFDLSHMLSKYTKVDLPFLAEFQWYEINDVNEYLNLSSVCHLMQSENFKPELKRFFGRSSDERVCAFAIKGRNNISNPLSNADDCTAVYVNNNNDTAYYVVGILLLDDGQYFCKLN